MHIKINTLESCDTDDPEEIIVPTVNLSIKKTPHKTQRRWVDQTEQVSIEVPAKYRIYVVGMDASSKASAKIFYVDKQEFIRIEKILLNRAKESGVQKEPVGSNMEGLEV